MLWAQTKFRYHCFHRSGGLKISVLVDLVTLTDGNTENGWQVQYLSITGGTATPSEIQQKKTSYAWMCSHRKFHEHNLVLVPMQIRWAVHYVTCYSAMWLLSYGFHPLSDCRVSGESLVYGHAIWIQSRNGGLHWASTRLKWLSGTDNVLLTSRRVSSA